VTVLLLKKNFENSPVFDEVIRRTKNIPIFGHPVYATADAAATHNDCACSEDHAKPTVDSAGNVGRVFKTYSVVFCLPIGYIYRHDRTMFVAHHHYFRSSK